MRLSEVAINTQVIIKKIKCNEELKKRFYSFGIVQGAELFIEATSMKKNTIEINIENTHIALRYDEAQTIEVEIMNEM